MTELAKLQESFSLCITNVKQAEMLEGIVKAISYNECRQAFQNLLDSEQRIRKTFDDCLGKTIDWDGKPLTVAQKDNIIFESSLINADWTKKEIAVIGGNFYPKGKYFEAQEKKRKNINFTYHLGPMDRTGNIAQSNITVEYSVDGVQQEPYSFTAVVNDVMSKHYPGEKAYPEITIVGKFKRHAYASILSRIDNKEYAVVEDDFIETTSREIPTPPPLVQEKDRKEPIKFKKPDYTKKEDVKNVESTKTLFEKEKIKEETNA